MNTGSIVRPTVAALLAALVLTVSACGGTTNDPGPLHFGGDDGELCFTIGAGAAMVTADVAAAPLDNPVTLTSLELSQPSGVVLQEVMVTPDDDKHVTIGSARYRPDDPRLADRSALPGTVIAAGKSVNVSVVLRRSGSAAGAAAALTLTYQVKGTTFEKSNSTSYRLADTCE